MKDLTKRTKIDADWLVDSIGHSEDDAVKAAKSLRHEVRIVSRDGESIRSSADYKPERVNFHVRDGKIARGYFG